MTHDALNLKPDNQNKTAIQEDTETDAFMRGIYEKHVHECKGYPDFSMISYHSKESESGFKFLFVNNLQINSTINYVEEPIPGRYDICLGRGMYGVSVMKNGKYVTKKMSADELLPSI